MLSPDQTSDTVPSAFPTHLVSPRPYLLHECLYDISREEAALSQRRAVITGDRNILVAVDRSFLRTILQELIRNAVKHSIDGRVTAHISSDAGRASIAIGNVACELTTQDNLRIPGEGQRGTAAIQRKTGGSGHGLHDVRVRCRSARIDFFFRPNLQVPRDWPDIAQRRHELDCTVKRFEAKLTLPPEVVEFVPG
jgi:hypothetical protein